MLILKSNIYKLSLAILLMLPSLVMAANDIGKVLYVKGVATVFNSVSSADNASSNTSGNIRILGRNSALHQKDVISIGKRSFAMIEMIDGTKMVLRPNTKLKLDQYDYAPQRKIKHDNKGKITDPKKRETTVNVLLHLLKGGLRSVSSLITKSKNKNYRIKTSVATIGIRGTEFDARLCEGRCLDAAEAKRAATNITNKKLVGRVAFVRGKITAQYKSAKIRYLGTGSPLYEGDRISSAINGYAVLAFSDKSRITLARSSEFIIREFNYESLTPTKNKSIIELVRGGFRALTGLIGKTNRDKVKYKALAVTIGIRGTGFDMVCDGLCRDEENGKGGMRVNVWNGKVAVDLSSGEQLISEGQQFFIASKHKSAKLIKTKPAQFKAPRPDKIKIDHDDLFESTAYDVDSHTPGLYVSLYDGFIELEDNNGNTKYIGAGEAIMASSDGSLKRLSNQPAFQTNDVIPRPDYFDEKSINFLEFMNEDNVTDIEQCEVR